METLDRSLRDITGYDLPFGGKVMVFGGDFRQVLPIVPRATRAKFVTLPYFNPIYGMISR